MQDATHTLSHTHTHTHAHTHTRIAQTDRGEGQCCLTEIFGQEVTFEERESSRVPDVLGKIVPDVGTEGPMCDKMLIPMGQEQNTHKFSGVTRCEKMLISVGQDKTYTNIQG